MIAAQEAEKEAMRGRDYAEEGNECKSERKERRREVRDTLWGREMW